MGSLSPPVTPEQAALRIQGRTGGWSLMLKSLVLGVRGQRTRRITNTGTMPRTLTGSTGIKTLTVPYQAPQNPPPGQRQCKRRRRKEDCSGRLQGKVPRHHLLQEQRQQGIPQGLLRLG